MYCQRKRAVWQQRGGVMKIFSTWHPCELVWIFFYVTLSTYDFLLLLQTGSVPPRDIDCMQYTGYDKVPQNLQTIPLV